MDFKNSSVNKHCKNVKPMDSLPSHCKKKKNRSYPMVTEFHT